MFHQGSFILGAPQGSGLGCDTVNEIDHGGVSQPPLWCWPPTAFQMAKAVVEAKGDSANQARIRLSIAKTKD